MLKITYHRSLLLVPTFSFQQTIITRTVKAANLKIKLKEYIQINYTFIKYLNSMIIIIIII